MTTSARQGGIVESDNRRSLPSPSGHGTPSPNKAHSTPLDRALADTFRAVRWAESAGEAVCPSCGRGQEVREGYRGQRWLKSNPALKAYYCGCCRYPFSDLTKTVLARSCRPLALWAYLAMGGTDEGIVPRTRPRQWGRDYLRRMREKLTVSVLAEQWAAQLTTQGITADQLAAQLQRDASWWGRRA